MTRATSLLKYCCLLMGVAVSSVNAQGAATPQEALATGNALLKSYQEKRNAGFLKIDEAYQNSLSVEKEKAQKSGNFETTVWIEKQVVGLEQEIDQLKTGAWVDIPVRDPEEEQPDGVQAAVQARDSADQRKYQGAKALNEIYLDRLPEVVRMLVQANQLEKATELKEFHEKLTLENKQIVTMVESPPTPRPANVPLDAVKFQGHYYKLIRLDDQIEWDEAMRAARRENGMLACIETAEEDAFLINLINDNGSPSRVWLGARFNGDLKKARWENGEELTYTNFEKNGANQGHDHLAYMNSRQWSFRKNRPSLTVKAYLIEWE